ncbi:unnamed protein product [marine sediment metagenome]|uniref:Uncharacterized protein n=1 Tax=marine sediment metagenome TaxID=412755 RepID=X1AQ20_9ZZZZ
MYKFASDPSDIAIRNGLRIIRTPTNGSLTAMLLNDDPQCLAVHWVGDRTIPHTCDGPCNYCAPENPLKIECYFGVWLMMEDKVFILSITDYAAQAILKVRRDHGKLRGMVVKCYRPSQKKNGRIDATIYAIDKLVTVAPEPPDVQRHLTMIFNINAKHLAIAERSYPAGDDVDDLRK